MKSASPLSLSVKIAVCVSIFFWASAFVAIRQGLTGFSPGSLACLRFGVAAACLTLVYGLLPQRSTISLLDKVCLLLIGAITLGSYHVSINYGEITVSAALSSFVISLSPILTTLFAIAFLREGVTRLGVCGLMISTAGMVFILFGQETAMKLNTGILFIFVATVAGSIYNVLQKPFLKKYSAIEVTTWGVWGSLLTLGFYLPDLTREIYQAPASALWSALYLGVFPTALATVAWVYALSSMPAARATNFYYFMPVITTVIGWVCLSEMPTLLSFLGGMIALFGVWMVNRSYQQRKVR
jgi:drug/metabolite transporter (DMT)-like permease